ncbi:MAG: hypothetical protein ACRCXZ_06690, partial [Patescibacteria group bacterium]
MVKGFSFLKRFFQSEEFKREENRIAMDLVMSEIESSRARLLASKLEFEDVAYKYIEQYTPYHIMFVEGNRARLETTLAYENEPSKKEEILLQIDPMLQKIEENRALVWKNLRSIMTQLDRIELALMKLEEIESRIPEIL